MDKDKLVSFHKKAIDRLRYGRAEVLRNCFDNLLFYLGQHWHRFDPGLRAFRQINTAANTPRPVVNLYRAKLGDCIAMLGSIEPNLTMAPGNDSDEDRVTANLGKDVLAYLERAVGMDNVRLQLAYHVGILNNAYAIADYDPDGGTSEFIPRWECRYCKGESIDATAAVASKLRCPECGKALGPSAETDELPAGKFSVEVRTPFETWVDYSIPDMADQPIIMVRSLKTKEWVRERYGNVSLDSMETTESGSIGDLGLTYLLSAMRLAPAAGRIIGGSLRFENSVIVDTLYALPTKDFPKGLWARLTSKGQPLESKDNPFHTGTEDKPGRAFIPATHFGYDYVPRAHIHIGPANDLKSPQRDYNRLLAHVKLFFARSANGVWWMPQGVNIEDVEGIEGIVLRGNTTAMGGGEPKRIEGANLPVSFEKRFAQILEEMAEITSLKDPAEQLPRIDSGYALNILDQRNQRRLNPVFRAWGASYQDLGTKLFHVFRNFAPDEVYYKIKGQKAQWSTKKLKAADLTGGVDIIVESESLQPKTLLQKQGAMERLINLQAVNPQDPQTTIAIARLLGATEFLPDLDLDEEDIVREQDAVKEWAKQFYNLQSKDLLPGVDPTAASNFPILIDRDLDNHPFHAIRHRQWMLSEDFKALPISVQQAFRYAHYLPHVQAAQLQAAQQAAQKEEASWNAASQKGHQRPGGGGKPGDTTGGQNEAASGAGGGSQGRSERKGKAAAEAPPAA